MHDHTHPGGTVRRKSPRGVASWPSLERTDGGRVTGILSRRLLVFALLVSLCVVVLAGPLGTTPAVGNDIPIGEGTTFEAGDDGPTIAVGEDLLLEDPFTFPDGKTVDLSPHVVIWSDGDTTATVEQATGEFTNVTPTDVAAGLQLDASDKQQVRMTGAALTRANYSDVDAEVSGEIELVYSAGEAVDFTVTELPSNTDILVVDDTGETMTSETTDGDGVATFGLDAGDHRVEFQTDETESFSVDVVGTNNAVTEDDVLTVTAAITNQGDVAGTQDVVMVVEGQQVEAAEVTLAPGERDYYTFSYETTVEDIGEIDVEVESDDDADTYTATIQDNVPIDLSVHLADAGLDSGEQTAATVTAHLLNGSSETVTTVATLESENASVVSGSDDGTVTGESSGTTTIVATYDGFEATAPVGVDQDGPIFERASVPADSPETIAIEFDREVQLVGNGDLSGLSVALDDDAMAIRGGTVEGSAILVDLPVAVVDGEVLTLGYEDSAGTIEGTGEAVAIGFDEQRVRNEAPVADLGVHAWASSYEAEAGSNLTLEATGAGDEYDRALDPSYEWTVDGDSVESDAGAIEYELPESVGEVEASVTVSALGNETTADLTVTAVDRTPPQVRLTADSTVVTPGEDVTLDASDSTDNVAIANYSWALGDGTEFEAGAENDVLTHSYDDPGEYEATVTVVDTSGNSADRSTSISVDAPIASVDRTEINFGEIAVGSTGGQEVSIGNDGTTALSVDASLVGDDATAYDRSATDLVVTPGQERTIRVTFAPEVAAELDGATLELETNASDSDTFELDLSGTGVSSAIEPVDGTRSVETDAGGSTTADVAFENTGTAEVTLETVELNGHEAFSVHSIEDPVIPGGETGVVDVLFESEQPETATATLAVETADGDSAAVTLEGTALGASIDTPNTIEFGEVDVGVAETEQLWIGNPGTTALEIEAIAVDSSDEFTVLDAPETIDPGERAGATVEFVPEGADGTVQSEATITVESNATAAETVSVDVTGTGVAGALSVPTRVLEFGTTAVGEPTSRNLRVSNTHDSAAVTVDAVSIVGTNEDDFSIDGPPSLAGGEPVVLDPDEEIDVEVNVTAQAVGEREAQLQIHSDARNDPQITVWLTNAGSYVIVEEVSNPTVNVDGVDLTADRPYAVNVTTASTHSETITASELETVLPDGGEFELDVGHFRTVPDGVDSFDTDDTRQTLQYLAVDPHDTTAVNPDGTWLNYTVDTAALPSETEPDDLALYRYDGESETWVEQDGLADGFEFRAGLSDLPIGEDPADRSLYAVTAPAPDRAPFAIGITALSEVVEPGEDVVVEYLLENTGVVTDTRDVTFAVEGTVHETHSAIELDGGETHEDTFVYPTGDDDVGELQVMVSIDDASVSETVTVEAEEDDSGDGDGTGMADDEESDGPGPGSSDDGDEMDPSEDDTGADRDDGDDDEDDDINGLEQDDVGELAAVEVRALALESAIDPAAGDAAIVSDVAVTAGQRLSILGPGESGIVATDGVALAEIVVDLVRNGSVDAEISLLEHSGAVAAGVDIPSSKVYEAAEAYETTFGTVPAAYLKVNQSLQGEAVDTAQLSLRVDTELLDSLGADSQELAVVHYVDGEWIDRPTTIEHEGESSVTMTVEAPRFSVFAIDTGAALFEVESASIEDDSVVEGEVVAIDVTVRSRALVSDRMELPVFADGDLLDRQEIVLEPGGLESMELTVVPESAGEFEITVGAESAGTLSVMAAEEADEDDDGDGPFGFWTGVLLVMVVVLGLGLAIVWFLRRRAGVSLDE